VLAAARWRSGWVLAPLGLLTLAAYSAGIEWTQLALARIDRACDVTDVVDNVIGAGLGFLLGLVLAMVLRPWRQRRPACDRAACDEVGP
jgi:glycopeptide antibiotics resistance protein